MKHLYISVDSKRLPADLQKNKYFGFFIDHPKRKHYSYIPLYRVDDIKKSVDKLKDYYNNVNGNMYIVSDVYEEKVAIFCTQYTLTLKEDKYKDMPAPVYDRMIDLMGGMGELVYIAEEDNKNHGNVIACYINYGNCWSITV